MIPREHQVEMASKALYLIRSYGLAYLAAEERTGKTLAAILVAEKMTEIKEVIVLTKVKSIKGWTDTLDNYAFNKPILVTNYHKACKLSYSDETLIILDEAHSYLAAYPKRGTIWKAVKLLCKNNPILYLSATPRPQGFGQLYNQFALSDRSPWKMHKTFYTWFAMYGIPYEIYVQGRLVNQYDKVKIADIKAVTDHLFITKTRKELGFEHEPEDILHYIDLWQETKDVYNDLIKDKLVELRAGMLVCDTKSKLRYALHMLEGGTAKIKETYHVLKNQEKIDFIKTKFGDTKDIVIMYNYIAELTKLKSHFKEATLLQATSYAEGVDLSMFKHLIIYSMDFSTAKYTQRRARQANMERKEEIKVHFLLVKGAISSQVYKTVAINKRNYVDSLFLGNKI